MRCREGQGPNLQEVNSSFCGHVLPADANRRDPLSPLAPLSTPTPNTTALPDSLCFKCAEQLLFPSLDAGRPLTGPGRPQTRPRRLRAGGTGEVRQVSPARGGLECRLRPLRRRDELGPPRRSEGTPAGSHADRLTRRRLRKCVSSACARFAREAGHRQEEGSEGLSPRPGNIPA